MKISRRRFLLGAAGIGLLAGGYARFAESRWLERVRATIPPRGAALASPIRILLLTDLHWSRSVPLALIDRAVRLGLDERPDLVCLAGDYVTVRQRRDLAPLSATLAPLAQAAPALAVLGNHDGGAWSRAHGGASDTRAAEEMLARAGITLLENRARTLEVAGQRLRVGGAGDLWAERFAPRQLGEALGRGGAERTLLLTHNSDVKTHLAETHWDLLLCGHTHGGQVRLPLVGALVVPLKDRRFVAGRGTWRERWIYTSRGVGSLFGVRWGCRPEVSLLTLQ
ncbi:MAG: phosphodiesterase YaeI [Candidatus Eisenbacteria bacterium]|nr:phosphodiesterase YaeI [Candidatus Eisenbacteria bacterium]